MSERQYTNCPCVRDQRLHPATGVVVIAIIALAAYGAVIMVVLTGASWLWAALTLLLSGPLILIGVACLLSLHDSMARQNCEDPHCHMHRSRDADRRVAHV